MRKRLFGFVALLAACAGLPVQPPAHAVSLDRSWPPPQVVSISIHADARAELESLATVTRTTHSEQAACVTKFGLFPMHGGWIVAILEIGPAPYFGSSDSLRIDGVLGHPALCPAGVPIVHSHVVKNEMWDRPSNFDEARHITLRDTGYAAPFSVLVTVDDKPPSHITIYGLPVRVP